jgi:hypothetical protein
MAFESINIVSKKINEKNFIPVLHVILHLLVAKLTTDQPLECEHGIRRVDDSLSLSREAAKTLAVLRERDDRGCGACAFGILDDARGLALHDRDAGVGRTQVNTDNRTYEM